MLSQGGGLASPLPVGNGSGDNAGAGCEVRFASEEIIRSHGNSQLEDFWNDHDMKILTNEKGIAIHCLHKF